jgi:hypothetical protein
MYATTRYNFVRLKAAHKISPLEELVGGDLPPSSSQRLTGMVVSSTPRLSGTWIRNMVVIGTDCTGSYKSNYHAIKVAPKIIHVWCI